MIRQFGVLAWKPAPGSGGEEEPLILLITSRETRRWVVPRGNPMPGLKPHQAAAEEAWEEAGVRGAVADAPLGTYRYMKVRRSGSVEAEVALYAMKVEAELDAWPEQGERTRRWFAPAEAAEAVAEAELAALIRAAAAHFSREMQARRG